MEELGEMEFEDASLEQRRAMIIEGIARGEKDVAEGKLVSHEEAMRRLSRWLDPEKDISRIGEQDKVREP